MSAIKLEAYLEGLTLEQAREQARQMSDIGKRVMFVNVRAHRRLGTDDYVVHFAISMWPGEEVEAIFHDGWEQTA